MITKIDFYHPFCLQNKSSWLNNLISIKYMNAKFSGFVIYVEAIIYLSLLNLHDYTFTEILKFFAFNLQGLILEPAYDPNTFKL